MQLTGLLLALSIAGQVSKPAPHAPLSAPLVADSSPTAWSCTVETLNSTKDCVFESEVTRSTDLKSQEAENIRFARELAASACGRAVKSGLKKGDAKLTDICQREFSAVAETCGLGGEWPLVDAKGRFAPAARACYIALSEVLQRASFSAATSSRCCQCLAASCRTPADRCYRDLSRATPDSSEQACMNGTCSEECATAISPPAAPEARESDADGAPSPSLPRKNTAHHATTHAL